MLKLRSFISAMLIGLMLFFSGCATGEKWTNIEEGMSKKQVRSVLGKQDQIEKKENGWSIYYYKNRLISGWSYDKTDYYIIFNPDGVVDSYGHGVVDTRTSERISAWSASQQINKKRTVSCTSNQLGASTSIDCEEE